MQHFFIIGAQRSGTTFLRNMLAAHPEVLMAEPVYPEPKFFLSEKYKSVGVEGYESRYYRNVTQETKALGEKSTSYIEFPEVADRILDFYPKAKAIAVLRNPVDRAMSNYHFSRRHGLETRTISQVFLQGLSEPDWDGSSSVSPFAYLERGDFASYLEPFMKAFRENMEILIFEELTQSDYNWGRVFNFIGVDSEMHIEGEKHVNRNASEYIRNEKELQDVKKHLQAHFKEPIERLENLLGIETGWKHD